jgi:uncharacterized iron-regulated protein
MRLKNVLPVMVLSVFLMAFASDKPAWKLYDSQGRETAYARLLKQATEADIVLFGELHNNPICHWLQFELASDLYAKKGSSLVLGAEMFETDGQLLMDEYLRGVIAERNFEAEAKLWPNYKTDYKPLVKFAAEKNIPFVATNIPRRYAAVVNRKGFEGLDSLPEEARRLFMPLPVAYDPALPGYQAMLRMGGHANENLPKAQAVKDATMAWLILRNFKPGKTFLHFHGTYHSDNYEGIVWYLNQYRKGLKILTISSVEVDAFGSLPESVINQADFIITIPASMTKTH